jgi:putative FmdB family regulatory protein
MIYDYKCKQCGEVFEVWATLSDKEKGLQPECPKCQSKETKQMMGALSIGGGSSKFGNSGGGDMPPPVCGPGCC